MNHIIEYRYFHSKIVMLDDKDLVLCINDLKLEISDRYNGSNVSSGYLFEFKKTNLPLYFLQRLVRDIEFEMLRRKVSSSIKYLI